MRWYQEIIFKSIFMKLFQERHMAVFRMVPFSLPYINPLVMFDQSAGSLNRNAPFFNLSQYIYDQFHITTEIRQFSGTL